ncbi:MAG: HAMP domain-containing protein [Ruminococcaceae bacterium]|nr:HAMP domain-containing protein [Oscillospiraceae bacterium]
MPRFRLLRSVFARTITQLTLVILLVFFVLGFAYYIIVSQTTVQQQASKLLQAAQAISGTIALNMDETGEINDRQVSSYVNFTARSSGAIVWIVNQEGELVLHTGIPAEILKTLERSGRGYYLLPEQHLRARTAGTSGMTLTGDFSGLFREMGGYWLSAVYPVPSGTLGYRGEIQLHYRQGSRTFASFLMTNGLIASFIIAFVIALLLNGMLTSSITRPIRLLAEAADKVARGDLTARVELPGIKVDARRWRKHSIFSDDLTMLVGTMNDMIEKLANQERDRKDFISSVSHDLRTPITSIFGFIEGMLDGTIPPERHGHYLEIVKQEVLRLQTLINTMFEGSVLEQQQKLNHTVFDINQVIKEDLIGLEALLDEKKLDVQTEFMGDDHDRLLVLGDREAISRVVYNIIINAIRFTPEDGIIALTTRKSNRAKEIEVVIDDSGPGVPEHEYPYIFDRFYKVDKSRTARGSGLGLYICRTILAAHGQRIQVARSDLGGARFVFTLQTP